MRIGTPGSYPTTGRRTKAAASEALRCRAVWHVLKNLWLVTGDNWKGVAACISTTITGDSTSNIVYKNFPLHLSYYYGRAFVRWNSYFTVIQNICSLKEDSLRNKLCYAVSLEIDHSAAALYPWPTNSLYYITQNTFLQKYTFFLFSDIKLSAAQLLNNDVSTIIFWTIFPSYAFQQ